MSVSKSTFTPAQVEILAKGYDGTLPEADRRAFVKQCATDFGKEVRSIIGKLSTMAASHSVEYVPYTKAAPKKRAATNQELTTELANLTGIDADTLQSLVRSSKGALLALVAYATPEPEAEVVSDEASGD